MAGSWSWWKASPGWPGPSRKGPARGLREPPSRPTGGPSWPPGCRNGSLRSLWPKGVPGWPGPRVVPALTTRPWAPAWGRSLWSPLTRPATSPAVRSLCLPAPRTCTPAPRSCTWPLLRGRASPGPAHPAPCAPGPARPAPCAWLGPRAAWPCPRGARRAPTSTASTPPTPPTPPTSAPGRCRARSSASTPCPSTAATSGWLPRWANPPPPPSTGARPACPPATWPPAPGLEPHDGSLVTVSTLSGLGEGEKIYAVRFAGPLAYVVTFRQTDPLYVIDLSQPAHPVLAGQLPLEGYSSSLQLLRPGLLLGIGQSVDADLRTVGLELEAFDVAQPGQPSLVSRQELGPGAASAAEHDPHALLWWPAADLVALPVDGYGAQGGQPTSAVELWTVGPSGVLSEAGSISQPAGSQPVPPEVEREVVVGQDLYTVSEQGVMASDLADLAPVAWLPYGAEGAGAA